MRTCKRCGQDKSLKSFRCKNGPGTAKDPVCSQCRTKERDDRKAKKREYHKLRYQKRLRRESYDNNRDLLKVQRIESGILKNYSYMQLTKKAMKQGDVCYLCGKETSELFYDVNIQTEIIDGLYCRECRDRKQPLKLYQ